MKTWDENQFPLFPFSTAISPSSLDDVRKKIATVHDKKLLSSIPIVFDLDSWSGDISSRRFCVKHETLTFECFSTPSKSKRLIVFLSAGGGNIKSGKRPIFQRASWHPWLDAICLNVADPTFAAYPGQLKTGWYLGSKELDCLEGLALLIRKIQDFYQIEQRNIYIHGSSAGGTSALKLAARLQGVAAIAENPPVFPHKRGSARYLAKIGMDLSSSELLKRNDLNDIFQEEGSRYFVFQNGEDKSCMTALSEFLHAQRLSPPLLGLNTVGSLNLYVFSISCQSPHHTFMSVDEFRSLFQAIDTIGLNKEASVAVMHCIYDGMQVRKEQSDKIKNLKGWRSFLEKLDLSDVEIPADYEHHTLKFFSKKNEEIIYNATLAHAGDSISFSVDFFRSWLIEDMDKIAKKLKSINVRVKTGAKVTFSLLNVPLLESPEKFKNFVRLIEGFIK